jgi:hypothetical protein
MDRTLKQLLDKSIEDKMEWDTLCIPFPTKDGDVNLCDYIGLDCKHMGECFFFPEEYNSHLKETRDSLSKALKIAAAEGKFPLVDRGWNGKQMFIRFECFRTRVCNKEKQIQISPPALEKKKRSVSYKKAQKGKECTFRFSVYWVPTQSRWCLFGGVKGNCKFHCHHLPMDPGEVKKSVAYIKGNDVQIAMDAAKSNAPPSLIGRLLQLQTGDILSESSLKNIRMQAEMEERANCGGNDDFMTQADQLLAYLENTPNISFCAIYDEPDSPLFTTPKPRVKNGRRLLHTRTQVRSEGRAEQGMLDDHALNAIDPKGELDDYVDRTRQAFRLNSSTKMLLGVAWTDDETRKVFARFSEVMVADVTEGTNNAKRPLFLLSGKTSNRNTYTALWAFLPQQARWAFQWVWTRCIPQLLPEQGIKRMRLVITDGDQKEYGTFVDAIPTIYTKCCHKLCHWHLLYRGDLMKVQIGKCGAKATVLFRVVVHWIDSWMKSVETENEYNLSKELLGNWLKLPETLDIQQGGMGRAIVSQINAFLTVSLFPHEKRWASYHFLNVRAFNTSASSYVEAENSALKRRGDGVKPNFSVPKAARVIHEGTQIRSLKRQQKAVHNLNATRKDKPAYYTKLTDLVDYVQDAVSGEFQAAAMFELFRPSATTFWVKKASYKHQGPKISEF